MIALLSLMAIRGVGSIRARHLIEAFGSAKAVLEASEEQLMQAGAVGQFIIEGRRNPRLIENSQRELQFIESNHILPIAYGDEGYPVRLLDCPDAPALLFQLGDTPLDSEHIISIVGTRTCTQYGRDMVQSFVRDLHEAFPDVVIVSGLALGIDVSAHRAALECGARTVGVVAHGLDRIYPYQHRPVAKEMLQHGGSIVTEYMTGTEPERSHFANFQHFAFAHAKKCA